MKSKSSIPTYRYLVIGFFISIIIILVSCSALLMFNRQMLKQVTMKIVLHNMDQITEQYNDFLYEIKTSVTTQVNRNGKYHNSKDSCYILLSDILDQIPDAKSVSLIYDEDFFHEGKYYFPGLERNVSGTGYDIVDMTDSLCVFQSMPGFSLYNSYGIQDVLDFVKKNRSDFLTEPHFLNNGVTTISYVYPFFNSVTGQLEALLSVNFPFEMWFYKMFDVKIYPNEELFLVTNNDYLFGKHNQSFEIRKNATALLSSMVNQDIKPMIYSTEVGTWSIYLTDDEKRFVCTSKLKESSVMFFYTCPLSDLWKEFAHLMGKFLVAMLIAVITTFSMMGIGFYRISKARQKERAMEDDIHSASHIQQAMLPKNIVNNKLLNYDASLIPAKQVGGDLYYYFMQNEYLYFCLGDVSGKGIAASLFMARTLSLYCDIAHYAISPADIAESLNQELCRNNDQNMFVTAFFGIFNTKTGVLKFCNAGQEEPVYWSRSLNSNPEFLKTSFNIPLGIDKDITFVEGKMQLGSDFVFILFSDGVSEAMNKADEMFGDERILQSVSKHLSDTPENINNALIDDIGKFAGNREQSDDITIFSFSFKPLHKELVILNNIKELEKLHNFMDEIQDVLQMPQDDMTMVKVAIDEAATNVVRYAYNTENQPISILAETCGWKLIFTISDQGVPFNPLEYNKPANGINPDNIEDITIGGLGISIIKESFDELEYKYENNSNILILKKTLNYGSKN